MRYVSVYSKSPWLKRIFMLVPLVVFVLPVVVSLVPLVIRHLPQDPPDWDSMRSVLLSTGGGGAIAAIILTWAYRRLVSTQLEASEMGLHHLGPGRERMIQWRDLIEAKKIHYGKGQTALRLKTKDSRYLIRPDLVPDTPDAPILKIGFPTHRWHYPDGHEEPMDVEHGFGWKLVEKYRPELLKRKS
jgi:hypothetical protein